MRAKKLLRLGRKLPKGDNSPPTETVEAADRGLVCLRLLRLSRERRRANRKRLLLDSARDPSTICPRQHGANICSGRGRDRAETRDAISVYVR